MAAACCDYRVKNESLKNQKNDEKIMLDLLEIRILLDLLIGRKNKLSSICAETNDLRQTQSRSSI
jgi:hypothetical protein